MQSWIKQVIVCLCVLFGFSSVGLALSDPNIVIDPNAVWVTAYEDGANPDPNVLTLTNTGQTTLDWSIDTAAIPNWISIAPISGMLDYNQSQPITLTYDTSVLSAGQYSYSFDIVDSAADNSPQTFYVDLEVVGPILDVSSNAFDFYVLEGGDDPNTQSLTISNLGGRMVNWSVDLTDKPDWLDVNPTSGVLEYNESETVTLSVDITGLPGGAYSYSFEVVDPAAANSPQTVTVDLEVVGPILDVSSNSYSFTGYQEGSDPNDQSLTISNTGGGMLNWLLDLIDRPDWLTITPISGSLDPNESQPVTLSVDITDLPGGAYSYSFDVIDPAAQNSPQTVGISLVIGSDRYVPSLEYPTIQSAIDAGLTGDTIFVSPGTYYENINFNGKNITLTSTDPEEPGIVASTIIDGGRNGSVVTFNGQETSDCVLDGFTITNGSSSGVLGIHGGGFNPTHATIRNCTITGNRASYGGGLNSCDGAIINCTITHNYAGTKGGGLCYCDGAIINCTITGNVTYYYAGGLYDCDGTISNCTIANNISDYYDTIMDNGAPAGLVECNGPITNCVIWNNLSEFNYPWNLSGCSVPTYSCIQDWAGGGEGNITSDPLFADPDNGDFHLKSEYGRWDATLAQWVYDDVTSPCIDAGIPFAPGDPNGTPADPNDDFLVEYALWTNELWPHGGRINMGTYGGTAEASMSADTIGNVADLDHDDEVSATDLLLFSDDWLYNQTLLDTDLNRDGAVDIQDFADLANQWLWIEP